MDKPCGGWTPDTLFQHFTQLRAADQNEKKTALDAMDKRLDGMNEFRKTVEDLSAKTLTRAEAWTFLIGVIASAGVLVGIWAALR